MTIDIDLFKDLLSSFAQISRLTLEIWDKDGVAFSTNSGGGMVISLSKDIEALSTRAISRESMQKECLHGKYNIIGVPIMNGEEAAGALLAYPTIFNKESQLETVDSQDVPPTDEGIIFLTHLAGIIQDKLASQHESEKLVKELTQSFEDLYLYSTVSAHVKTLRFSSNMLNELIEELLETMRSDLSFASLPDRQEYDSMYASEDLSNKIADPKMFIDKLLKAIPSDEPTLEENYFILNDSGKVPSYSRLHSDPYRFLTVRIQHDDSFYGWLGLVSFNLEEIFRRGELKLLISVAEQVAAVLSNTDLYNELESFVINVVKSLVYTIEEKDLYTHGNSKRVSEFSGLIADKLGLDSDQKEDLNWAAILHDIGKIGIPELILNKTVKLDDSEYDVIKGHPMKGYHILQPIKQLNGSLPGILHHHERFDGNGYPDRLKGEEIPLMARIIAIADTFDAISSSRAYRSARSRQEALAIMEKAAGTQLDPELVGIFKSAYAEI